MTLALCPKGGWEAARQEGENRDSPGGLKLSCTLPQPYIQPVPSPVTFNPKPLPSLPLLLAPLPSPQPKLPSSLETDSNLTLKLHSCFLQVPSHLSQRVTILKHKLDSCPLHFLKTLQLLPTALRQTAKILCLWRQPTCPSMHGWIKDMW